MAEAVEAKRRVWARLHEPKGEARAAEYGGAELRVVKKDAPRVGGWTRRDVLAGLAEAL